MTATTPRPDNPAYRAGNDLDLHDRLHMRRSRGATSGALLVLLGIWGGLVPFAGPLFGYAFTPDQAWDLTWGRLWLEVLPAAATVLGGLLVLGSANRVTGWFGAWLAAAGGLWFVVGQPVSRLWNDGTPAAGEPASASTLGQVAEQIGFFTGLGAVIVFLAAAALGRMSVVGIRDVDDWAARPVGAPAPTTTPTATTTAGTRPATVTDEDDGPPDGGHVRR